MTDDSRLRGLLEDAVADVEPRHGVDQIHARTGPVRRRRRTSGVGAVFLVAAATVAVIAGVAVLPSTTGNRPGLADPTDDDTDTATQRAELVDASVFYLSETGLGLRLAEERVPVDIDDPVTDAVRTAVSGQPTDGDYTSAWPSSTEVGGFYDSGDPLRLDLVNDSTDLAERPASVTAKEAELSVQQVVQTVRAGLDRDDVALRFTIDGAPTDTLLGVDVSDLVAAGNPDDVLAPVSVTFPTEGMSVESPFTVEGTAATFEANVQWELRRDDEVVESGFATAQECCTLSPYDFEVDAPPGAYTLVVREEDVSEGEGNPPSQDTKRVVVR